MTQTTATTKHQRENSIIPIEFRNNTRDGGMERAALATVFGVKEYTESKIFWNDEDFVLDDNVVTSPKPANMYTVLQRKKSYTNYRHKALPSIPVVSEFGDIWSEVNLIKDNHQGQQRVTDVIQDLVPKDLSNYPITLFDLIKSDENPNLIVWGMTTITTVPPTAPTNDEDNSSINTVNTTISSIMTNSGKKRLKWSLASIKNIKKKASLSFPTVIEQQQQPTNNKVIEAATIEKLIEKLTLSLDYTFMTDFFLIYRVFMTPLQLCKFLITRFHWSIENNQEERCIVRIRTFVVLRHWLLNYFLHDFIPSKELRIVLTNFLNTMPFHPLIKQSPRDQRIIKGLKRVVRRLKKIYYASEPRVQVIVPPPPTFEQQKVTALVKDKLTQSTIKQKTLNIVDGIHVDARHSNNTAIKNNHQANVIVIGNIPNKLSIKTTRRRRGSSVSSSSSFFINGSNHHTDDGSKEWSQIQQCQYHFDNDGLSDNSLESNITPGTSSGEEEDEDDGISISSTTHIDKQKELKTNELSEKLNDLHRKQLEQDDIVVPTTRSFYSAQLAIPSVVSTPEMYYPSSSNQVKNSISYNSMTYPSVTESGVITPPSTFGFNSNRSSIDPKLKQLPPLHYSKTKQLPPLNDNEVWKILTPKSRILEIDIDRQNHPIYNTIPSTEPTMIKSRNSIVLSYSTSLMAQQFCLIEKAILLDINWEELVDCKWTKMANNNQTHYQYNKEDDVASILIKSYSRKKRSKQQEEKNNAERGVEKTINRFNSVCQWVSSEIVLTADVYERARLIEKFIRLAKKCKLFCNFSTLLQILLGLQSPSISRLEKTWPLVRKKEMKILQELSNFTSPTKNWKMIRDSMTKVAEEYGESPTEIQVTTTTIKLPFGGCIPFLGIYLSDLVFNAELPSFLPNNNNNNNNSNPLLCQPLVHFRKHRITATVIKRVLVFQRLSQRYSFDESQDHLLYSTCLNVHSLDADMIYNKSLEIEPL